MASASILYLQTCEYVSQNDIVSYVCGCNLYIFTASKVKRRQNIISTTVFIYDCLQKNNHFVIYCYPSLSLVCQIHWTLLLRSTVSCIHQTLFLGIPFKSVIVHLKTLPLNSYYCENNLDLFFRLVQKWFWKTHGFLSVTEIVYHMFIIFVFSLYNMPFFTPPYLLFFQRYSSKFLDRTCFWF